MVMVSFLLKISFFIYVNSFNKTCTLYSYVVDLLYANGYGVISFYYISIFLSILNSIDNKTSIV